MKISYECDDLIKEIKEDIEEFGNIDMYAFFEEVEGYTFITNYDFIEESNPLQPDELENTIIIIMKATEILKKLEEQNKII